jgi:anti-sigma regulatory factor (Ser/Thr protein kinase)
VRTDVTTFRHEALLYAGERGFMDGTLPFVRTAVAREEPILVAVSARKISLLRDALGADAERVRFADMARLGANPARIIPAWSDFAAEHAGRGLRGIGEPIWAGRSATELSECHRHEALLNLAFDETPDFWLMCPYDTDALAPGVVEEAACTHPRLREGDDDRDSPSYAGLDRIAQPHGALLPDPPPGTSELAFGPRTLSTVRELVARRAAAAGLDRLRAGDLVLAINELATNSVRHGGGRGTLCIWEELGAIVCEVRDGGRIDRPLAGRERPVSGQLDGYGLWLVNQLCDLVQLRCTSAGNVVRAHMHARSVDGSRAQDAPGSAR